MLGSFKIGSVLGITVRVHWLFLALIAFVLLGAPGPAASLDLAVYLLMLFGLVFLHELGHSLVARRFGIRVYDITFWPLGGMARMSEIPEIPRVELLIALAGPAVNFALAALALPLAPWSAIAGDAASVWGGLSAGFAGKFLLVNLALGTFNLVPAFPMDGGRVLRAWLARSGDWVAATERAALVGRLFALAMIALALAFPSQGLMLPLIGVFVWFAGSRELAAVRARHARRPSVASLFEQMARVFGQVRARAQTSPPEREADAPRAGEAERARPGPLSAADIERLERFRGPLRQFRPGG